MTWEEYGQDLEGRNFDLHARVHSGRLPATVSLECACPRPTGGNGRSVSPRLRTRILGRALVEVLNAIYECDFLGFSYGFRPGRSQHLRWTRYAAGITHRRVNWVLGCGYPRVLFKP